MNPHVRATLGGLSLLSLAASGCADLDPIALNACGNQVLEASEDCDSSVSQALGQKLACGTPGTPGACRYVCSGTAECPSGWGCGADSICRSPSAELDTPIWTDLVEQPDGLACGDFDGDGHQDIVGRFPANLRWMWGDGTGTFVSGPTLTTAIATGALVSSNLDGDDRQDLVAPGAQGLEVWRGTSERQPVPVAYAPFPLGPQGARILPIRAPLVQPEAFVLALFPEAQTTGALLGSFADGQPYSSMTFKPPVSFEHLAQDVGLGDLDGDSTDDVAVAFIGTSTVHLLSPHFDLITAEWRVRELPSTQGIEVGSPKTCESCSGTQSGYQIDSGVRVADLDGDGALDLLISLTRQTKTKEPPEQGVAVALRTPGGGFAPPFLDDRFDSLAGQSITPGVESSTRVWPLALGRTAGTLLVVGANGVFELTTDTPSPQLCRIHSRMAPDPWTHAAIADVDGDGDLDVVAIADGRSNLSVLRRDIPSTGCAQINAFDEQPYSLPGLARGLALGRVRGNAGSDILVVTSPTPTSESSIFALWTNPWDWPEQAKLVTVLPTVEHVTTALARYPGWPVDAMEDVWVTTNDGTGTSGFGVLSSNAAGGLTSPFHLYHRTGSSTPKHGTPRSVLRGQFFEPSDEGGGHGLVALGQTAGSLPFAWPLPLRAHAQFPPLASAVPLRPQIDASFELDCSRFVSGDFDGDGRDEAVGLFGAPLCAGSSSGEAELGLVSGSFAGGSTFTRREGSLLSGPLVDAASADVDGDGISDLVLIEAARARVLWGGEAWLERDPTPVEIPGTTRAVTPLTVRGAGARARLVVATDQGLWAVSTTAGRELEVERVGDEVLDVIQSSDFDADGLEDVVGLSEGQLVALRALPRPPVGGP
ncbi:MAG: hypothetical protein AMXMBFR56_79960 [Polyangiaceae bacterium]